MTLETATEAQLEILTQLMLALWPECDYQEEYTNNQKLLTTDNHVFFLAKEAEAYMGFSHISLRTEYVEGTESGMVGYLEGIYVKPDFRKSGVGKSLIEAGEGWAKAKGCTEFASDTEIENQDSIRFHQELGYHEVNRIVCFVKKL